MAVPEAPSRRLRLLFEVASRLEQALDGVFILQEQSSTAQLVVQAVLDDLHNNAVWYNLNPLLEFHLREKIRRLLRVVSAHLTIKGTGRAELLMLKKAVTVLCIGDIQKDFTSCWTAIWSFFLRTKIAERLPSDVLPLLNVDRAMMDMGKDAEKATQIFREVFPKIESNLAGTKASDVATYCLEEMETMAAMKVSGFDVFDAEAFQRAAGAFSQHLLALDPQSRNDRILSPIDFSKFLLPKAIFQGRFGQVSVVKIGDTKEKSMDICMQVFVKKSVLMLGPKAKIELAADMWFSIRQIHKSIVPVLGFTSDRGRLYIAHEAVQRNLDYLLHEGSFLGPLTLAEILPMARDVLDGMSFLHERGITHGDIRPSNIMAQFTSSSKNKARVKLANFSFGLVHKEPYWQSGLVEKSLVYRAPEVLRGKETTTSADVYSFAITFWEMLQRDWKPEMFLEPNLGPVARSVLDGGRPSIEKGIPSWAKEMLEKGWQADIWRRPTAFEWKHVIDHISSDNFSADKLDGKALAERIEQSFKKVMKSKTSRSRVKKDRLKLSKAVGRKGVANLFLMDPVTKSFRNTIAQNKSSEKESSELHLSSLLVTPKI